MLIRQIMSTSIGEALESRTDFLRTWQCYYSWRKRKDESEETFNNDPESMEYDSRDETRKMDVQRAGVCSFAVNMTNLDDVKEVFIRNSKRLQFLKFVVSPFQEQESQTSARLLIAVASQNSGDYLKTVYVAFQGAQCMGDGFDTVKVPFRELVKSYGLETNDTMSGWFHGGLHKLLLNELPSMKQIFDYCQELIGVYDLQTGFRVVFCGHGMGGAISHMALLSHLLCLSGQSLQRCPLDNLVSIAFGAPAICNSKAAEYFRSSFPVEDLFHNYMNDGDSVSVLFNNLEEVRKEAKLSATQQLIAKIQRVSTILSPLAMEPQSPVLEELTNCMVEIVSCFPQLLLSMDAVQLQGGQSGHHFCPFGKYWRLQRQMDDGIWLPIAVHHSNITQTAISLRPEGFQAHSMTRYLSALLPEDYSRFYPTGYPDFAGEVGNAPEVLSAVVEIVQGEHEIDESSDCKFGRITVKGTNFSLLFSKKCEVSFSRQMWKVVESDCDAETVTFRTTRAMERKLLEELRSKKKVLKTSVQIITAYGCSCDLVPIPVKSRNFVDESIAIRTLNTGLVKLLIMSEALRKMSISEINKQHMKQLRLNYHILLDALSNAADLAGLKVEFEDVVLGFEKPNLDLLAKKEFSDSFSDKAREALCEDVIDLLSGLDSSISDETALKLIFAVQHVRQDDYQRKRIVHHLARYFCPWLGGTSATCLSDNARGWLRGRGRLDTYDKFLTFFYSELFRIYNGGTNIAAIMKDVLACIKADNPFKPTSISSMEEEIACQIDKAWSALQDIKLVTRFATPETEERLSRRLKLFHSFMSLRTPVRAQTIVAVVGLGNCGKSTLVNLLTSCTKQAETGHLVHTTEASVYTMKDSEALVVDFPGSYSARSRIAVDPIWRRAMRLDPNWEKLYAAERMQIVVDPIWKKFGRFADLYVMMTKFTGDVTQEDDISIKTLFDMVGENARVVLLVNQVDGVLKGDPGTNSGVWKEFTPLSMKSLKDRYAFTSLPLGKGFHRMFRDVHFSVTAKSSIPSLELQALHNRGVLIQDEVGQAIRKVIDEVSQNQSPIESQGEQASSSHGGRP